MNKTLFLILFVWNYFSCAQIPDSTKVDGKKIATELLNEITLTPLNLNGKERIEYYRLRRKVHKVYPYAQKAKKQLQEIEEDLKFVETKRQKRRISKLHDRWLQKHFTEDLKDLTRSEGRILIKLIHYETGMSSYELIQKYRNGLKAMLWQRLAKFYDGDLKTTYQPNKVQEDSWIEHALWEMKHK